MERLKELDEELRKMNVAQLQDWMDTKAELRSRPWARRPMTCCFRPR